MKKHRYYHHNRITRFEIDKYLNFFLPNQHISSSVSLQTLRPHTEPEVAYNKTHRCHHVKEEKSVNLAKNATQDDAAIVIAVFAIVTLIYIVLGP